MTIENDKKEYFSFVTQRWKIHINECKTIVLYKTYRLVGYVFVVQNSSERKFSPEHCKLPPRPKHLQVTEIEEIGSCTFGRCECET